MAITLRDILKMKEINKRYKKGAISKRYYNILKMMMIKYSNCRLDLVEDIMNLE